MRDPDRDLSPGWRRLRFDAFLRRVERKIVVDDGQEYSTVGVRLRGRGAYVRDTLLGSDIARKQQWEIRAGDVVYNKLFAWRGSFAIAGFAVDGLIVSDKFPTYRLDPAIVDGDYLRYYFMTESLAAQARAMSKGAAAISKLTLNPPQFWDLTIPVPPSVDEQRHIAAVVGQVEASVHEAVSVAEQVQAAQRALRSAAIAATLGNETPRGRLEDVLLERPRNGWSPRCDNTGGVSVLSLAAVTGFAYRRSEVKTTSEPTDPTAHYWLAAGDLLITRSNTPELVGHAAIYDGSPTPCIYPDLMMRIRCDPGLTDTRFVHLWLQSRPVREYIRRVSRGTSPTMKKIAQGDVQAIPFPTHLDLREQQRMVGELDRILAEVEAVATTRARLGARLEQVLPGVLDRAFSGMV